MSLTPALGVWALTDSLSPCHWSSLSILTRFSHPPRCGQRVGEREREPGDGIEMNEREREEQGETEEKTIKFVMQILGNRDMFREGSETFFWLQKYSQVSVSEP